MLNRRSFLARLLGTAVAAPVIASELAKTSEAPPTPDGILDPRVVVNRAPRTHGPIVLLRNVRPDRLGKSGRLQSIRMPPKHSVRMRLPC